MKVDKLHKWISITDRFTKIHLNREFESLGINSSQHMFLLKICENEGITQDKLADIVKINKSNVTRALGYLEKNGFIRREMNENDRRTALLFPTERAREIYPEIISREKVWDTILKSGLSEEERAVIEDILIRVATAAINHVREEGG